MPTAAPKLFRVTVEVGDLDRAAELYAALLGVPGTRHPGSRHYFDCGGVVLGEVTPMNQTVGVALTYRFARLDELVHARLGERGLVGFVVAVAPVAH